MKSLPIEEQRIRAKASVAKMHVEEYAISIQQLSSIGSWLFIFAIILLSSTLLFEARDWPFIIISVISGILIYLFKDRIDWSNKTTIIIGLSLFVGGTLLEFLLFGFPYQFIPNLVRGPRIVVIGNAFSPVLYPGLKLMLAFPFINMLRYKKALATQPKEVIQYLRDSNRIPKNLLYLISDKSIIG